MDKGGSDPVDGRQHADMRSYVAVLFCDMSDSTRLAAELDADAYSEILEAIRRQATAAVGAWNGLIAQIYGDGMLCVFEGAGGTLRAVEAAGRLHASVAALEVPPGSSIRQIRMHSGVHSGLVLLRDGDPARGTVEVVGRTTTVAARLSAAALPGEILVSAGSIGPDREAMASGPARMVEIGGGVDPVRAIPVRVVDHALPAANFVEPRPQLPYVGREALLAHVARALELLRSQPLRLLVEGPPGMGKSRLARELLALAGRLGVEAHIGACSASSAAGPLQIVHQIALARPADQSPEALDPEGFVLGLTAVLARQPVLLILDDWQWADSASAALLSRLSALQGPLGLILACREGEAPDTLPDGFARILLPPLRAEETLLLVRSRRPDIDPIEAARIHVRAGGNPLFVEELCRLDAAGADGLLPTGAEPRGAGWISSLVAARIRQLPQEARQGLDAAVVAGMSSSVELLERLVGREQVAHSLPVLLEQDLLVLGADGQALQFKHGITWEVAYSLVPLAVRRTLHGRLADMLQADPHPSGPDHVEALAWHCLASDRLQAGWRHAEAAGDRAVSLGSVDRAQLHYRMALEALLRLPAASVPQDRLTRLVARYGYVCIFDAERGQLALFDQAIARAREQANKQGEAEAEYWRGFVLHGLGDSRAAVRHCTRALAAWEGPDDHPFPVQVRATLGAAQMLRGDYDRALPLLDDAVRIKRVHRSGRQASPGTAYALALRAAIAADTGQFVQARQMIAEAEMMVSGVLHPAGGSVMAWYAAILAWQGDWAGLVETGIRGRAIAQQVEAVYIHAVLRAFENYGRWKLGEGESAAAALRAAIACMEERGKTLALSMPLGYLAEVEAGRDRAEGCRIAVAGSFQRARQGEPFGIAPAALAWARMVLPHNPARARALVETARRNGEQRQSPHVAARCDLTALQLGLVAPGARKGLAERTLKAFAGMGMWSAVAEVENLAGEVPPEGAIRVGA